MSKHWIEQGIKEAETTLADRSLVSHSLIREVVDTTLKEFFARVPLYEPLELEQISDAMFEDAATLNYLKEHFNTPGTGDKNPSGIGR